MTSFVILLAANIGMDELLKLVLIVVFAVIYVFNHLVGAAGKGRAKPARPDARPPRPNGKTPMQDEVAEFLKRATEKRAAPKPEVRPPQPRRLAPVEIVDAQPVDDEPAYRWPQPMQPHVDNRDLAERAANLTHVDRTEAAFQTHMQVFDHAVGSINEAASAPLAAPSDAAPPSATPAHEVFAALLADPRSLRQAIVLNEIMARPTERW